MNDWERDLSKSAKAFDRLVWPVLSERMPGRLIHLETIKDSDFAYGLDIIAGFDALHVNGEGIRGVAVRMQECPLPYDPFNTFTIRKSRDSGGKTEYEKRKEAVNSDKGWLYPHLTIQGYVRSFEEGELLSFAVARTKDLINAIEDWEMKGCPPLQNVYTDRTHNAEFYVIEWGDICQYIFEPQQMELMEAN